ncbi:MAG: hypothetical protein ACI9HK_003774 [Pirellulaceae bacterium]|jgi:hypothetical protein
MRSIVQPKRSGPAGPWRSGGDRQFDRIRQPQVLHVSDYAGTYQFALSNEHPRARGPQTRQDGADAFNHRDEILCRNSIDHCNVNRPCAVVQITTDIGTTTSKKIFDDLHFVAYIFSAESSLSVIPQYNPSLHCCRTTAQLLVLRTCLLRPH